MLTPTLMIAISLAHAGWTDDAPLSATPAQLLQTARESVPAKDHHVDVLVDEERYTIDEEGRVTVEDWLVYKIVDASAVDGWGVVSASWAPWHQAPAEVRARVIDPDGREWTLDPKTLVEATGTGNATSSFDDNHTLQGPLPGIKVGSVVEQVLVFREHRAFVGRYGSGNTRLDRGGEDEAVRVVRVEAAPGVPLQWAVEGPDDGKVKVQERHSRGATVLEYRGSDVTKLEDWQKELSLNAVQGHYLQFTTAPSWSSLVAAYAAQIEPLITPNGLDEVLAAAREGKDEASKIRLAVRAVQARMRYAAIPFGEHAIVPYTPADALSRAYGDCKDQAVTVTAALRALGLDAHVALLWAGATIDLPTTVPRMDRFNHAIVVVKRASGDLWIDPTVRGSPVGELPYGDEHRVALVIDANTTGPVFTPRGPATYRQEIDADLRRVGPAPIRLRVSGTGWAIGGYRNSLADLDGPGREKWAEGNFGVDEDDEHEVRSTFTSVGEDDDRLAFEVSYLRPTSAYVGLSDSVARVGPSGLLSELPIADDKLLDAMRTTTDTSARMRLSPEHAEVVWHLQLPPGMSWDAPPVDDKLDVGPVHLTRTLVQEKDGVWTLTYTLDVTEDAMTLAQGAELADALKIGTYTNTLSLTAHAEYARLTSDDHTYDAVKLARDIAAANPDSPLARAQYVIALEDLGFDDAATRETAAMKARWPDAAETARALLTVATRDDRGRYLEGDWDRPTALAALEHLATLEPKSSTLATLRIRLLISPLDTLTPPPAADVTLASTLLDALLKQTGETTDTKSLRVQIRYLNGDLTGLAALPFDDDWSTNAAGDWMAAVLLKRGPSAVALTRQAVPESVRSATSRRAMQDLTRARHPELSHALLSLDLPGEFAKAFAAHPDLKPWETVVDENDPIAPFIGWTAWCYGAAGFKPAWAKFESPSVALDEGGWAEAKDVKGMDPLTKTFLLDSLVMMFEPPVTDHELARAVLRDLRSGQKSSQYAQVDGNRLRVIGDWSTGGAVAHAGLDRLARHDIEGAERVVTWIGEDVDGSGNHAQDALAVAFHSVWPAAADVEHEAALKRALTVAALFGPSGWTHLLDAAKATPALWPASTLGAVAQAECSASRWQAAVTIGHHAQSVGNTDRGLTLCLLRALRESHDFDGAVRDGRAWLSAHPDDRSVLASVAASLYALGRTPEALDAARTASVDRTASNSAAWLMLLAHQDDEALKAITPAGTEKNANTAVRHTYAVALVAAGRLADAATEWERVRTGDTLGPEWWVVAGGMAEGLGLRDQAITAYRQVDRSEDADATWQFAARALTRLGEKP